MRVVKLSELSNEEKRKLTIRYKEDISPIREKVLRILEKVKKEGDSALIEYTRIFDGIDLKAENLKVSEEELEKSFSALPENMLQAIEEASRRIRNFHMKLIENEKKLVDNGICLRIIYRPIERVGVYVPGGRASYPSTALMTIIPAKVAGVEEVIVCTPPGKNGEIHPATLAAIKIAGASLIYKVGGAQAIAAMAYGTQSIPKVDKIIGPGNIYVTVAKMLVYGEVDIDLPAGPSEILVFADETANADFIALDLLSQAEHDPYASAVLVTTSPKLATDVQIKLYSYLKEREHERRDIISSSLRKHGLIVLAKDLDEAIDFINLYAPEHLEICAKDSKLILDRIRNAGTILIGDYSPVALSDYATGANHVLPTGSFARAKGGLSTNDFMKKIVVQELTREGLKKLAPIAITLARMERLFVHAEAIKKRLETYPT